MMIIHHTPNANYFAETLFVEAVRRQFPDAHYPRIGFAIAPEYLEKFVKKQRLLDALVQDVYLPNIRKQRCIELLANCPPQLKVTSNPADISFDMVITTDKETYYWEFHEDQHRNWKCGRDSSIYDAATGEEITVPRYLQRLVRDVWRFEHFRPYTIIWKDWYEANQNTYIPELIEGFREETLPEKFSFRNFYNL
jgi:hypothetical protein